MTNISQNVTISVALESQKAQVLMSCKDHH